VPADIAAGLGRLSGKKPSLAGSTICSFVDSVANFDNFDGPDVIHRPKILDAKRPSHGAALEPANPPLSSQRCKDYRSLFETARRHAVESFSASLALAITKLNCYPVRASLPQTSS
jgi:hypothetical protein